MTLVSHMDTHMGHEPVTIRVYIADVPKDNLNFRCEGLATKMGAEVAPKIAEIELKAYPTSPLRSRSFVECQMIDNLYIPIFWNVTHNRTSDFFNYVGVYHTQEITDNLEISKTGAPSFFNSIMMADSDDKYGVWTTVVNTLNTKTCARDIIFMG